MPLLLAATLLWTWQWPRLSAGERSFGICLWLATLTETIALMLFRMDIHNQMVYKTYAPVEFLLLLHMPWAATSRTMHRRIMAFLVLCFAALVLHEWTTADAEPALFSMSMLLSMGTLTVLYAALLIVHAEASHVPLVRTPRFWMLFSVLLFMGPALPFLGIVDELHAEDPASAQLLFGIVEVLFLLRYGSVIIAAWLLYRSAAGTKDSGP